MRSSLQLEDKSTSMQIPPKPKAGAIPSSLIWWRGFFHAAMLEFFFFFRADDFGFLSRDPKCDGWARRSVGRHGCEGQRTIKLTQCLSYTWSSLSLYVPSSLPLLVPVSGVSEWTIVRPPWLPDGCAYCWFRHQGP